MAVGDLLIQGVAAVLVLQYPAGILVWLDARRLGVEHPDRWLLAVVWLAIGWVAVAVYLHRRDDLVSEHHG